MDPRIFGLPFEKIEKVPPGEMFRVEEKRQFITIGVQEVVGGFKISVIADVNHPVMEAVASTPRQAAKRAAELLEQVILQNKAAANGGTPAQ